MSGNYEEPNPNQVGRQPIAAMDMDKTSLFKSLSRMSAISKELKSNIYFISDYKGSEYYLIPPGVQYDDLVDSSYPDPMKEISSLLKKQ